MGNSARKSEQRTSKHLTPEHGLRTHALSKPVVKRPIRIEGDVAYVSLTKGLEAAIDACDVPLVEPHNWHARIKTGAATYAAYRLSTSDGKRVSVLMHRVIAQTPDDLDTDHRDGNGLNNRRSNLRNATKSQNMHNARQRADNSSGYKGVCWHKRKGKWEARIRLNGRQNHLGYYDTPEAAFEARSKAAHTLHQEFARMA